MKFKGARFKFFFFVVTFSVLSAQAEVVSERAASPAVLAPCPALLKNSNIRPFTRARTYRSDYNLIRYLPFYNQALELHLRWAREMASMDPVIIDAGGGTGNMSIAIQRAMPRAKVLLLDLNQAMLDFARAQGFPARQISVSNVTQMRMGGERIKSQTVDHILSHSVLWALEDPAEFFREANRVLKMDGTLAVSTAERPSDEVMAGFLSYLNQHLTRAEMAGRLSAAQKANFLESNRQLVSVLNSPLSRQQLIQLGAVHGFQMLEVHDAYVVPTPHGPKRFFNQVLFRKISSGPLGVLFGN